MGGAQPLAATMNGATFLAAEIDRARIQKRLDTKYCDEVSENIDEFPHGFTAGGHPVGCAIALKAIDVIINEGLLDNVREVSPYFQDRLNEFNIVILSRYVDGGADLRSKQRVLSSQIINFFCRLILSNKIKDYTSGIFVMKREVLMKAVPIGHGHGEFFIEFIYKALKAGVKIIELPYVQPPDVEKMSKTASSTFRFCFLGFNYFIRLIQTLFGRN